MSYYAVIGSQFGDEGKGLFTDYLCSRSRNPLVVRFSGGQQAGHTVYHNGKSHVFSNFGAGTLKGAPTLWMNYCTFDPIGVVNEYKVLKSKGVLPRLYVDGRCPVTTPYDIIHNRSSVSVDHGTCGFGVGATHQREEDFYSLVANDLLYDFVASEKIVRIQEYYNKSVDLQEFLDAVLFIRDCKDITIINDKEFIINWIGDVIFEGSQGLLLDQNIGFFPHVTRSNTGLKNLDLFNPEVFYITRAYQTRHGAGPMSNFNIPHNIKENPDETNITNQYQGVFRKAILDVDLIKYAIEKDSYYARSYTKKNLVITCLDQVENEYRFTYNGKLVYCLDETEFITKISNILKIDSIFISRTPDSFNIEIFEKK